MDPNAGKKKLMNRLGREDAIAALHAEDFTRRTTSFYRYVDIANPEEMRDALYEEWSEFGVFGRVYLAKEGINAQISVPEHNWDSFIKVLHSRKEFADMHQKIAIEDDGKSFFKLMLKTKDQIVADGLEYGAEAWYQGPIVVNLLAQKFPGKPGGLTDNARFREAYFQKCLGALRSSVDAEVAKRKASQGGFQSQLNVVFPDKIGCGLAGGDWKRYRKMITDWAATLEGKVFVWIVKMAK